jgi:hypothetical protein
LGEVERESDTGSWHRNGFRELRGTRENKEAMELSSVTVVILVMAGLHLFLDCVQWVLHGSRAGVRATTGK